MAGATISEVAPRRSRFGAAPGAAGVIDWQARWHGCAAGRAQLVVRAGREDAWHGHWLSSLSVRPCLRGFGIATAVVGAVAERARLEGAAELLVAVHDDNVRAIALYRKLGFERIVLPAVEPILADELERLGRRRLVMRLQLVAPS
jgi:ribosomal protein S18 acetylase RimI-like enzyme